MGAQAVVGTAADLQGNAAAYEALASRALASSADRKAWLRARVGRVTATEAAKLAGGSAAVRRGLLQEKLHPEQVRDISGDRYVARGNAREAILAQWMEARFPGLRHNDVLYAGVENPRHAATPDVCGVLKGQLEDVPAGTFTTGDIKTSKHDLDPTVTGGYFWTTTYMDQLQWQMYVTGARVAVFLWEQHDDQWPDPQPLDLEPRWVLIHYQPERVSRMIAQADLLLTELDLERSAELHRQTVAAESGRSFTGLMHTDYAGLGCGQFCAGDGVSGHRPETTCAACRANLIRDGGMQAGMFQGDQPKGDQVASVSEQAVITSDDANAEADLLGLTVLSARKEESTAKARKDTAWKRLQLLLADRPSFSHTALSRVTWTNEVTTVRVPDQEAALAAPVPDAGEDVTGQDLHDDLQRAREAWDAHQAKFWQDRTTEAVKLTVTDPAKRAPKADR